MEDEYVVEEFSDDDYESSSSEDDDIQCLIKQRCGLVKVEDDFEAEVDKVMTAHMLKLNPHQQNITTDASTSNNESESVDAALKQEQINDELLYDPNMDDEDEKWVDQKRRSYIFPTPPKRNNQKIKPLPNSDAVLNCPACLSLLCMDCQRHAVYKSQYRAMFVSNCTVIDTETLKYPKKKKHMKKGEAEGENDTFNPVRCSVCNTEVAVYDADEIYHFFNVLASY